MREPDDATPAPVVTTGDRLDPAGKVLDLEHVDPAGMVIGGTGTGKTSLLALMRQQFDAAGVPYEMTETGELSWRRPQGGSDPEAGQQ